MLAAGAAGADTTNQPYSITNYTVFLQVKSAEEIGVLGQVRYGVIDVMEFITFRFQKGSYGRGWRRIPHFGYEKLIQPAVMRGDGQPLASSYVYDFDAFNGFYEISWVFDPTNGTEMRTFIISYTVYGALESVSRDQLGFDWNAIGAQWATPIQRADIFVLLPVDCARSPLLEFKPDDGAVVKGYEPSGSFYVPDFTDNGTDNTSNPAPIYDTRKMVLAMVFGSGDFRPNNETVVTFNTSDLAPKSGYRVTVYFPKTVEPPFSFVRALVEHPFLWATIVAVLLPVIPVITIVRRRIGARTPPRKLEPDDWLRERPMLQSAFIAGGFDRSVFITGLVALAKQGVIDLGVDRNSGALAIDLSPAEDLEAVERLEPRYAKLLDTLAKYPTLGAIAAAWSDVRAMLSETVLQPLLERVLVRSARQPPISTKYLLLGGITGSSALFSLLILIDQNPYYAVLLGGLLLGTIIGGYTIAAVGGFFVPNLTSKGVKEYAQQRALIDLLFSRLEEAAQEEPDRVPQMLDTHLPLLSGRLKPSDRNFPATLQKIAPRVRRPYQPEWYDCPHGRMATAGEGFGHFARCYGEALRRSFKLLNMHPSGHGARGAAPPSQPKAPGVRKDEKKRERERERGRTTDPAPPASATRDRERTEEEKQ